MAGNSERIDDVIDPVALKQVDDLSKAVSDLEQRFIDTAKAANQLNAATGNSRSFRDYNNNATAAATATARLQQAQSNAARSAVLLQSAQQRLQTQTASTQAAQDRATAAQQRALSPYQQLSRELDRQRAAAKDLAIQYGENSVQFQAAAANVQAIDGRLRNIDQTLGQSQRNVGNYTSGFIGGFQKIYSIIRQAAFILPGIGISGIFLLLFEGIKNIADELGIFTDKISQAKSNLDAFNEVNKAANVEAGKQASNLRILYQAATDVTNSIHNRTLAARELQKEFPDTFKNITTETILNGGASASYQQLTKDIIANAKAKAVADKLGKIEADLFDSDVQTQKVRNAQSNEERRSIDYYTKALVGQGVAYDKAREAASKATFEQTKYENSVRKAGGVIATPTGQNDPRGINGELNAIRARANDAIKAEQEKQKILKNTRDFLIKLAGGNNAVAAGIAQNDTPKDKVPKDDSKQILNDQLKAQKEIEDQTLNNTTSTYEQRIAAIETFERESYEIINKGELNKVLTELEASNLIKKTENDALKDRNKTNKDFYDEQSKIINDALKRDEQTRKDIIKNSLDVADQYTRQQKQDAQNSSDDQLQILADQYAKGLISAEAYQANKKQIEATSTVNQDQIDVDGLKFRIAIEKQLGEDALSDSEKLAIAERKLSKDTAAQQIQNAEDVAKAKKDLHAKEQELANAAFTLIQTIVDAGFTKQLNGIQDQKTALDERTKSEIDAENRSLDSSSTKADKIAVINAKAAAQQTQLDNKASDIKRKQAEADRIFSIAKAIEATALAEVQALSYLSNPFTAPFYPAIAATIAAIGAVQLATILATPIPKYQHGTTNAKGGISLVGEVGKEYVIEPFGKSYMTPDNPTLMNIPKGSKVISNMELMTMMANPNKQSYFGRSDSNAKMIEAMNNNTNKTIRVLRGNKPKRPIVLVDTLKNNKHNDHRNNHFR